MIQDIQPPKPNAISSQSECCFSVCASPLRTQCAVVRWFTTGNASTSSLERVRKWFWGLQCPRFFSHSVPMAPNKTTQTSTPQEGPSYRFWFRLPPPYHHHFPFQKDDAGSRTRNNTQAGLISDGSDCGLQIRRGLATQRFDSS